MVRQEVRIKPDTGVERSNAGRRTLVRVFFFWYNAHRELEKKSGRKVVTSGNYLSLMQAVKKAKRVKH